MRTATQGAHKRKLCPPCLLNVVCVFEIQYPVPIQHQAFRSVVESHPLGLQSACSVLACYRDQTHSIFIVYVCVLTSFVALLSCCHLLFMLKSLSYSLSSQIQNRLCGDTLHTRLNQYQSLYCLLAAMALRLFDGELYNLYISSSCHSR